MALARVRKGDVVMVMAGRDRGKTGRVLEVFPRDNGVLVEKLNIVKKHMRPTQQNKQGGIVEKEALLLLSKVMPVCPKTHKPTRIRMQEEKNKKVRFSVKGKVELTVVKAKK